MASSIFIPDIVEENLSGIFATNPTRATLPVITAPTEETRAAAHNTIRQELVVVACANLKETNFAFDSSVVDPKAADGFTALARVIRRHPQSPMTLFGHADPTGTLRYNHFLSERRARSIFAVMVRDVKIWEQLFSNQQEATGDVWGVRSLQMMLVALGSSLDPTEKFDKDTQDAVRALLGLGATTPVVNNAPTRALIFERYMDFLRGAPSANPPFPNLTPNDFLGRGKQKATLQGCSEFNPQLLMSKTQQDEFDKDKDLKDTRDAANEPNRRIVIYLFAKGTVINPTLWPCPAAVEGQQACIKRQWSNGKDRRATLFDEHRRRFGREVRPEKRVLTPPKPDLADELGKEEKTFGCRFYHGIALHSPCERDLKLWAIQLLVDVPTPFNPSGNSKSADKIPLANKRFVATIGTTADAPVVRGSTSDRGFVALPLLDPKVSVTLKVDAFASLAPPKPPPGPLDPPPPDTPTSDSARFDDEDQFVTLQFDAGALTPIRKRDKDSLQFDDDFDSDSAEPTTAERELAAMQRLYNLGFGSDDTGSANFGNWTPADRKRFVEQFQRDQGLTVTGVVDKPTTDALFVAHGS